MDLILEWLAITALPACSRSRWVPSLDDKSGDDTMEDDAVVVAYPSLSVGCGHVGLILPSMVSARKFRTALGASLPHNST